jgi:MoaA/NifB/PqqE/SkfB family radical SAM enzyme
MKLQNFKKYFISKDDILFLNKNFDKHKEKWFESVFLYITENCQLKCKHCYLGERLKRRDQMTIDQIKAHLTMWKDMGAKRICFIGGEPTLHPDYPEAVRYANNLGYDVIMDTDGIPPSLDVLKKFSNTDFKIIQVSLDGATPKTHEKIRGKDTF